MAWKKSDDGAIVVGEDGNPIFVKEDGTELNFDAERALNDNSKLRNESKSSRLKKEELENKLKEFGDYQPNDVLEVMNALEEANNSKKSDEEKWADKMRKTDENYQKLMNNYKNLLNSNYETNLRNEVFSAPILDNLIPGLSKEKIFKIYKDSFKNEDGKTVAYYNGNPLTDPNDPSQNVSVHDALEFLVNKDPDRDSMLKASGASGSGSKDQGKLSPNGIPGKLEDVKSVEDWKIFSEANAPQNPFTKQVKDE